jgi:vacuolar protein sorting-associated protein VTA1
VLPCCFVALCQALELPKPTKEISGLIKATFAQCEKDKPAVKPDEEADRMYCENFALNVFRRADKVDRAGRADMNTCKAYYAAAIFLQVRLVLLLYQAALAAAAASRSSCSCT